MPRVAVIIPAFNAEATIAETLLSASSQTFQDIEIVVVSDGSTDATSDLVRQALSADPRIRLMEQANAGVAAARNSAIDATDCEFVAPLDADDIWHASKLASQIASMETSGSRSGLVYNWSRVVDEASLCRGAFATPRIEGNVFHRLLRWNFIGNGSTPLIRRKALSGLRYDPSLRAEDAGGCEDYLLQLQIAREWEYSCVPAYLTGYRRTAAAMSQDRGTMLRSHIALYRRLRPGVGRAAQTICDERIAHYLVLLASHKFAQSEKMAVTRLLAEAFQTDAPTAAGAMVHQLRSRMFRAARPASSQYEAVAFEAIDPALPPSNWKPPGWMKRYASLDYQAEN